MDREVPTLSYRMNHKLNRNQHQGRGKRFLYLASWGVVWESCVPSYRTVFSALVYVSIQGEQIKMAALRLDLFFQLCRIRVFMNIHSLGAVHSFRSKIWVIEGPRETPRSSVQYEKGFLERMLILNGSSAVRPSITAITPPAWA